jgi:short-subunit dehydrogenase
MAKSAALKRDRRRAVSWTPYTSIGLRSTGQLTKGPLWASPETVARGIERAIARRKDLVHLPGFWRMIMLVIRAIPESLFKKLKL